MDRIEELFTDAQWVDTNFCLASAFVRYMVALNQFPWKGVLPADSLKDVASFVVLCAEVMGGLFGSQYIDGNIKILLKA